MVVLTSPCNCRRRSVYFSYGVSLLSAAALVDCCVACQWQRHVFVVAPRLARPSCANGGVAGVVGASSSVVWGPTFLAGACRLPWVAAQPVGLRLFARRCWQHLKDPPPPEPISEASITPRRRCSIRRGHSSICCYSTSHVRQRLYIFVCLEPNKPASKDNTKTLTMIAPPGAMIAVVCGGAVGRQEHLTSK